MQAPVLPYPSVEEKRGRRLRADEVERRSPLANGSERVEIFSLAGRLRRIEEPDGSSLAFRYDADGRITEARHSSGESADYRTEDQGRRFRSVLGRTETVVELGEDGLPAAVVQRMDGHEWRIEYRHDEWGQVNGILYPQTSAWLTYEASRAGGRIVTRIGLPGCTLAEARFDARGMSTEIVCANGAAMGEELAAGAPANLRRIRHRDSAGNCLEFDYAHDEQGRIVQAGAETFAYDSEGRLAAWGAMSYSYDEAGRLATTGDATLVYQNDPAVRGIEGDCSFAIDALGRRNRTIDNSGETHYGYNLYGQLTNVLLPDGTRIRYHYDGFGRLVARETSAEIRYFIVGFDGLRQAEAAGDGRVERRYLWMAQNCIAMLDATGTLTSLHRIHGSRLAAIGGPDGSLRAVSVGDPYGAGTHLEEGVPGFGSLFGDPKTGLWLAGSRWLDSRVAQFLTPDTWFGTEAWNHLPRDMRHVLDRLPGGTDFSSRPLSAYCWCDFDPINRSDPNGHNPLGLFWSVISAFFWQMQVTSVALQMEVINIIVNILLLPFSFLYWDFYKKISIFNAIPPLIASYRLMVPFAFPLNGIYTAGNGVFTMGAVIWARGDQLRNLEDTSQRDLLICPNADTYRSATDAAAAETFLVRNPDAHGTATVNAAGTGLTNIVLDAAAGGATVPETFDIADWVAIRLPAGEDEFRQVNNIGAASIDFTGGLPALPAAMLGQNVLVRRLDSGIVRINKGGQNICRSITFIRGTAIHYSLQVPEAFPASGFQATEYLPAAKRNVDGNAALPSESVVIQFLSTEQQADYDADNFVRIRSGSTYFGRKVFRRQGETNIVLDAPLPALVAPAAYDPVEVVKMDAGATVNAQAAAGDRVDCGTLVDLRKFDGLAITAGGTTDRRIAIELFVRCPITALPAALHAKPLTVEVVIPGAGATGKVSSNTSITAAEGQADRVSKNRPVRVRAGATDFLTVVSDISGDTITLSGAMPAADFAIGTEVTVTDLAKSRSFEGDPSPAPGESVVVTVDDPTRPVQADILFIREREVETGGAVRAISAATTVVAKVDSNPSSALGLDVQRFSPLNAFLHEDAKATPVVLRVTVVASPNPFVVGDELHIQSGEEAYGKVLSVSGQDLILEDPIGVPTLSASGRVQRIKPTGSGTANANLDESLIMIPADLNEEPVTRRRAVELHEMRHVWQYSVLGPFFFSQPLPWLFHLGFAIGGEGAGHAAHNLTKWISLGLVDKLFAVIAWGIGKGAGLLADGTGNGVLNGKVITFDEGTSGENLDTFTADSPVEVTPAGGETLFNIVDSLNKGARQVTLRFTLDGVANGTRVTAGVSAFDKMDRAVNKYFSLNLERLWSDHIPVGWGRALSGLLNRENWFPLLGFYPLSLAAAGFDQSRVNFEQDASFQSGDIYNPFTISDPNEVFVGQFTRVHAFVYGRGSGDTGAGLSTTGNLVDALTVEPPVIAGKTPQQLVAGSVPAQSNNSWVHFRENWMIPLKSKTANVIGALFAAAAPGSYRLHTPGELDRLQRMLFFSADFFDLRTITVKPLVITPALTPAKPMFETEEITLAITGDPAAEYGIRYKGAAPANAGTFDGLKFSAPALPVGGAPERHNLEIIATYKADAAVLNGAGQEGTVKLNADQRVNVCQDLSFDVAPLVAPAIGPVSAGASVTFQMPFPPIATPTVTSGLPAGATVPAAVVNGTGRPATLTFHAPDAVAAAVDVTFDMLYRVAPEKKVSATVRVIRGIEAELTIDGADAAGKNYIAWAPTHSSIRIKEAAGASGSIEVRLENQNTASGGQLIFYQAFAPGVAGTDTLTLNLPADGTAVEFHVAGKFGRASTADGDAVIQLVATATSAVIARKALMVRVRKNAVSLTDAERDRFLDAFAKVNGRNDAVFSYGAFRDIHRDAGTNEAHFRNGFLPWHRAYILDLERELQKFDPTVALPYWRFDQPAPRLFSADFMGVPFAAGNPLVGWTTEGVVGVNRTPEFNTATEAAHGTDSGEGPVIDEAATLALGGGGALYQSFCSQMEGNPHGAAHISFTGLIDTIDTAVRDPLFFLLHCNVDRLWAKWQRANNRINASTADPAVNAATYPLLGAGTDGVNSSGPGRIGHNLQDTMWPWNGVTGGDRPPTAPGGALSGTPAAVAQVPAPKVGEMLDFQGVITLSNQLGVGYDDVPF